MWPIQQYALVQSVAAPEMIAVAQNIGEMLDLLKIRFCRVNP
jgi:hypothetical protein